MPPKGKWDICPEEKGRMSIMNKKVLGIAAAAAAAGGAVYAASKVKKQAQAHVNEDDDNENNCKGQDAVAYHKLFVGIQVVCHKDKVLRMVQM